jgi:5'-deoxynucleotidase YfbR-like HD superfamily hydrolase
MTVAGERIAPWLQTWSGAPFDLLDPKPSQIRLCDIAKSLERIPRFNAHTAPRLWTVAHHSLLVANLVSSELEMDDPGVRLAAILDDAEEAYTGDITAPVKAALAQIVGFDPVKVLAVPIKSAILRHFGLPDPLPVLWRAAIKRADEMALFIEKKHFMGKPPRPWVTMPQPEKIDSAEEILAVDLYFGTGLGFLALVNNAVHDARSSGRLGA